MTALETRPGESLPIREKESLATTTVKELAPKQLVEFGKAARELFMFAPGYRNFNHGTIPP
jgi:hypothetical protein